VAFSRDTDVRKLKSLIAIMVVFIGIFFVVPIIWLMLMGDPLPPRVRSQFNSIAYMGSTVRASLGLSLFTKTSPTGQRYQHIADRFDELIDKAIEGLNVNRIDEAFLVVELDRLETLANAFLHDMNALDVSKSHRVHWRTFTPKEVEDYIDVFWKLVRATTKEWEKVPNRGQELTNVTIQQLNAMRWKRGPVA